MQNVAKFDDFLQSLGLLVPQSDAESVQSAAESSDSEFENENESDDENSVQPAAELSEDDNSVHPAAELGDDDNSVQPAAAAAAATVESAKKCTPLTAAQREAVRQQIIKCPHTPRAAIGAPPPPPCAYLYSLAYATYMYSVYLTGRGGCLYTHRCTERYPCTEIPLYTPVLRDTPSPPCKIRNVCTVCILQGGRLQLSY